MRRIEEKTNITNLNNFKLDALSTFWQFDQATLNKLEAFISERFKYPKGGGWDLDSLRVDILVQNDLLETDKIKTLLQDELAANQRINLKSPNAIQLISQELRQRYQPNLSTRYDHQIIQEISQVIYAMEAVRLGIFKPSISEETLPSEIVDLMKD